MSGAPSLSRMPKRLSAGGACTHPVPSSMSVVNTNLALCAYADDAHTALALSVCARGVHTALELCVCVCARAYGKLRVDPIGDRVDDPVGWAEEGLLQRGAMRCNARRQMDSSLVGTPVERSPKGALHESIYIDHALTYSSAGAHLSRHHEVCVCACACLSCVRARASVPACMSVCARARLCVHMHVCMCMYSFAYACKHMYRCI